LGNDRAKALAPGGVAPALEAIAGWRANPARLVACPVCGREGLTVTDLSARPWAEWYRLACSSCGLDHTLHIPMRPMAGGLD
jgi:hypothetical protein